jgi:hypothetical protein
LKHKGLSRID